MDYLGKGEMLTNRDVNKFVHKMIFGYGTFLRSRNMGPTLYMLRLCSVYVHFALATAEHMVFTGIMLFDID